MSSADTQAQHFMDILGALDLHQHVNWATHKDAHTSYLMITRSKDSHIHLLITQDHNISNHYLITFNIAERLLPTTRHDMTV